jgi:hypothetical protein
MRLAQIANTSSALVRKFKWFSGTHQPFTLDITLEYLPPRTLNDEQETARTRILGRRKFNTLEDLDEQNRELQRAFHTVLATRVKSVEGLTLRNLANMIALNVPAIKTLLEQMAQVDPENAKKGMNAVVKLDTADETKISEKEREVFGYDEDIKTHGHAAFDTILFLLHGCDKFTQFVADTISDVSFFQDSDWESQLKN